MTTQITNASNSLSVRTTYTPPVQSATITDVAVNNKTVDPRLLSVDVNRSVVRVDQINADATVLITERLTVLDSPDTTHIVTGNITSGDTTVRINRTKIRVNASSSLVDQYDTDNNNNISPQEVLVAIEDFRKNKLSPVEVLQIIQAFKS
jgi:hypothetical protein